MAGPLLELIQKAEEKYNKIQQLCKHLTKDQQRLLISKNVITKSLEVLKHEEQISCRKSTSNTHGRYLCISNGSTLVFLDLKDGLQQKSIDKPQPLPKIHTLVASDFLGQQTDSHLADIILGQQTDSHFSGTTEFSCFVYAVIDSASCKMYRLSTDGADFCISEQHTSTPLHLSMLEQDDGISPKYVPIIIPKVWLTCSASEIPNSSFLYAEGAYELVIADQVYATDCKRTELMVYNTTTSKTSKYSLPKLRFEYMIMNDKYWPIPVRHVAELLRNAFVRCIGKLEQSDSRNPLYVVIAVMKDVEIPGAASAYLVTSTGQVLCYQLLPDFFGSLSHLYTESSLKLKCLQWSVISVDEVGKTWCAIVPMSDMVINQRFLFISTFTVEECLYDFTYGPLLQSILPEKREEGYDIWDVPLAQELHFLDVEMKEWNVYNMDKLYFPQFSACFLSTL